MEAPAASRVSFRPFQGTGAARTGFFFMLLLLLILGAARAESGMESWAGLQNAINEADTGNTITLTGNVTAGESDTALIIPKGKTITIDLNGFTIDRKQEAFEENIAGSVIRVESGARLTIRDSGTVSAGIITGGYEAHGGGVRNYGTVIRCGSYIGRLLDMAGDYIKAAVKRENCPVDRCFILLYALCKLNQR